MSIKQAMIFAAGYGKRMLPITKSLPKALLTIKNKTLLEHQLDTLIDLNFKKIVVNAFYLKNEIVKIINKYDARVKVIIEEELLETGGGVLNALKKEVIKPLPILLLNSDIFWIDHKISPITIILKQWNPAQMEILLCLKDKKEFVGYHGNGDFNIQNENQYPSLVIQNSLSPKYVFTGLQIINSNLISDIKKEKFSIRELFLPLIKKKKIFGFPDTNQWFHFTSPKDYYKISKDLNK